MEFFDEEGVIHSQTSRAPASPTEAFEQLLHGLLIGGPQTPTPQAGELVVLLAMRVRQDDFGPKEARQLGRLARERYHALVSGSSVMTIPREIADRVAREREDIRRTMHEHGELGGG